MFVILLILLIADCYDLKFGIIPNKLSLVLLVYGMAFNLILSILFDDSFILLFSIALTALIGIMSFILWYIGFWGGGDLKVFIGLSLSLSFLDSNHFSSLNLPISNQFIFYPKPISILLNAILIAFALIFIVIVYEIMKNKKIRYYSFLSIIDSKCAFNQLTRKSVDIESLEEGMVLDKYYFKNQMAYNRFNDEKRNNPNINLNAYKEDDLYYFYTGNRIGLTKDDVVLIMDFYHNDLIKNPNFEIKIGMPFMPFITLGYVSFLLFGDFISIISGFIKLLF